MIQAKNIPNPLVHTGTEMLVISKSLNVKGLLAVVALCCGPRAMNLAFVIDQASMVGGCESAIGMVMDQPGRGSGKLCLVLFLSLIFFRGCHRQPLYCFHFDFRYVTLVQYIYIYIYIYIYTV